MPISENFSAENQTTPPPSLPALQWLARKEDRTVLSVRCPWCSRWHHHPQVNGWQPEGIAGQIVASHCRAPEAPPAYRLDPVTVAHPVEGQPAGAPPRRPRQVVARGYRRPSRSKV
jgi:hypothetical protein